MKPLLFILLGLTLTACTETMLGDLPPTLNISETPRCFDDIQMDATYTSETRADVDISFTSLHAELSSEQREQIFGIEVYGGTGINRDTLPADATTFRLHHLRIGQPYHVTLQFITEIVGTTKTDYRFTIQ